MHSGKFYYEQDNFRLIENDKLKRRVWLYQLSYKQKDEFKRNNWIKKYYNIYFSY